MFDIKTTTQCVKMFGANPFSQSWVYTLDICVVVYCIGLVYVTWCLLYNIGPLVYLGVALSLFLIPTLSISGLWSVANIQDKTGIRDTLDISWYSRITLQCNNALVFWGCKLCWFILVSLVVLDCHPRKGW